MAKLNSFTFLTLNGYYKGPKEDISWHKNDDPEKTEYANTSASSEGVLIFGRVTYEMMVSFWPTSQAMKQFPKVAEAMNNADKIVFSRKLKKADWKNTKVINGDMIEEIKKLKKTSGKTMTILGSGSILTQLAAENLIDEYRLMVDPVVLGKGTPLFKDIDAELDLKLINSKITKSGVLILTYESAKK